MVSAMRSCTTIFAITNLKRAKTLKKQFARLEMMMNLFYLHCGIHVTRPSWEKRRGEACRFSQDHKIYCPSSF